MSERVEPFRQWLKPTGYERNSSLLKGLVWYTIARSILSVYSRVGLKVIRVFGDEYWTRYIASLRRKNFCVSGWKFKPERYAFVLGMIALMAVMGFGQAEAQGSHQATFTADKGTPLIGEPIQLTLTVQVPAQSAVTMPTFPSDWPPFMVKDVGTVSVTQQGDQSVYQQILTVILWQPGDYQTPQLVIPYQPPGSAQISQLTVQPIFFTVPSVFNDTDLTLRPFKPPIELPYISIWAVGAALVIAAVGAFFGVRYWRTSPRFARQTVTEDALSHFPAAAQAALRELKRIGEKVNSPAEIYAQTADCLRIYLHGRFDIYADEMTTGELQTALEAKSVVSERRQRELDQLLERADLVKFAHLEPKAPSAKQFLTVAERWIQTIEQESEQA